MLLSLLCRLVKTFFDISSPSHFLIPFSLSGNTTQRAASNIDTEDISNKYHKNTKYKCITSY